METENKNIKNIVLIVAIVIVVGVVVLWLVYDKGAMGSLLDVEEGTPEQQGQVVEDMLAVTHEAINQNDISVCKKLENEDNRMLCEVSFITQQAQAKNDQTICNKLDGFYRSDCKDQVLVYNAISNQDPSLCEKVVNELKKEQCLEKSGASQ
ncbi:MAG TPA: hypothetical protein ENH86_00675 [Candidatus Jorgensenbacteria bacterium]|uniref:Uncharacterized protein n=1 Tax=marine sediment metagenome TaxID=412755 RepID=A0A0F9EQV9_9ZZZZ|nr:hypothetical protein [Candidatus Jorgensenbacteria bacterium]